MKLLFRSLGCAFALCVLFSMTGFFGVCDEIRGDVFRLHIIANSDSEEDQRLKLMVRDELLRYSGDMFGECGSREESIKCAGEHIEETEDRLNRFVREQGYDYTVRAYVTDMDFDTREYDGFTLPAGHYDALRVVIGSGKGHNWWCVLYPALCVSTAEAKDVSDGMNGGEAEVMTGGERYRFRFRIVELWEDFCSWFRR